MSGPGKIALSKQLGTSLAEDVVKKMDLLGVDIFRIKLSHVEINEFEEIIIKVKGWTDKQLCLDTKGAQLRTGNIKGGGLHLKMGSTIKFGNSVANECEVDIPLNIPNPGELLSVGDLLKN